MRHRGNVSTTAKARFERRLTRGGVGPFHAGARGGAMRVPNSRLRAAVMRLNANLASARVAAVVCLSGW